MNTLLLSLSFFVFSNFIFGLIVCNEIYRVHEGGKAVLECSGNAEESVWYISWVFKVNSGRTAITTCYKDECVQRNGSETLKHNITERTTVRGKDFTSQLEIENVTADLRNIVIECILGDIRYKSTDLLEVMETYNFYVIRFPDYGECTATMDSYKTINVKCEIPKVYPEILCRIFPEVGIKMSNLKTEIQFIRLPELNNVANEMNRTDGGIEYFNVYCASTFTINQCGSLKFYVEIFFTENLLNPVLNLTTNALEIRNVTSQVVSKKPFTGVQPAADISKTAFYMLVGSVLAIGGAVVILMWVLWTKRKTMRRTTCSNTANQNDHYESIQYSAGNNIPQMEVHVTSSDEGYGESAERCTTISGSDHEEDTYRQKLLEESGYVKNFPIIISPTCCTHKNVINSPSNVYIIPGTPTPPPSRSSMGYSSPEQTSDETLSKSVV